MNLSKKQQHYLRGLGHSLKPVVTVGDKGLSESVLRELDLSLGHHELIKVKIRAGREDRPTLTDRILKASGATLIHSVGQMILLFRRNPDRPRITLP
jgi:RNA-binding protein